MKTGQHPLPSSKKTCLSSISREHEVPAPVNAVERIDRKNAEHLHRLRSPVLSRATQNAGLMLYEMLSMAELMRVAYEKGELASVQNRLTLLRAEAEHLASALCDILAFTKLEGEPAQTAGTRFDIVALLHEVSEAGRSMIEGRPVTIMDVSCAAPVVIYSDPVKIKQIMMGLMSNAVRYTERGRIALILSRDGDEIRLTVADTGRGMAQEQIDAVHDSPDHGAPPEMNDGAISGLGLRIVKALVKKLRGSISIASKAGEGTIAAVSFPVPRLQ